MNTNAISPPLASDLDWVYAGVTWHARQKSKLVGKGSDSDRLAKQNQRCKLNTQSIEVIRRLRRVEV